MITLLLFAALLAPQHPVTEADLALLKGVADAQISPDGLSVAYTRTITDYDANTIYNEVVITEIATGHVIRIFPGTQPRWAPNGKSIAYRGTSASLLAPDAAPAAPSATGATAAGTAGESGILVFDLGAAKPRFLTPVETTDAWLGSGVIKNFEWSPDSKLIAFVNADPPNPAPTAGGSPGASDVREFSRIMYKTRTGFADNRRTHIWIVPVAGSGAGGEAKILTPGKYDEHSISWSPDSRRIAFISNHTSDPDNNYSDHIFIADVPSGVTTQLTRTSGTEFHPAWSPDGSMIAYLGWVREHNTKDSPAEDTQLFVVPAAGGGAPKKLSTSLDRRITDIAWHPNSRAVYCTAGDRGAYVVYRIAVDRGTTENITNGNNTVRQFSLDDKGLRMAYVQSDMTHPSEVWISGADGRAAKQLSQDNVAFLRDAKMQDAETFWFDSFDGARVQGWIMKPAGWQANGKYPALLYIHGGPHGMFGYTLNERFQTFAAQGYAIIFINPRGSAGYGQAFSDGSVMNWGGGDYKDLMAGLDYALSRSPWIDSERLGVIGGSYGGFMTNWIITQTQRFKAAVSIAGLSDLISFYGTSLYSDLIEAEFNGLPWDNWSMLWQWSPLHHVAKATTPTLFIHGEVDHDVPITQAEEMYVALRKLGVKATLVRYPNEGHGNRIPQHVRDEQRRTLGWFQELLKDSNR